MILIVDDESAMIKSVRAYLEFMRFERNRKTKGGDAYGRLSWDGAKHRAAKLGIVDPSIRAWSFKSHR
jgi:DNA-binding response OmpR family regulator